MVHDDDAIMVVMRPPEPARVETLATMRELLREAGLPTAGLEDAFPHGYVVSQAGGEIVGMAGLEIYGEVGLLRSVAVRREVRGRGLGGVLVADRLDAARATGLTCVFLLTTTASDYFRRWGFANVSREDAPPRLLASPEFASVCPASAACLALPLRARRGPR